MRRTFTPHGNDLGVWLSSAFVLQSRFTKAVSNDGSFAHVDVKFGQISHDRRKYFLKDQALPLLCWDCGETPDNLSRWQLFTIGDEAAGIFLQECDLSNLQFPVQMAGIIVVADGHMLEARRQAAQFEIEWATKQGLPLVIAAIDYTRSESPIEAFRDYLGLDSSTPIVTGPALSWSKEPKVATEFAKRVLEALYGRVKAWS